jgi:murein DD-endopeptidase MepM/ murein hydrolase activator NlpD
MRPGALHRRFLFSVVIAAAVGWAFFPSGLQVSAQQIATITLPPPGAAKVLYEGCNNIALTFPDGTASQTVVAAVTPAGVVQAVWRHNAALSTFEGFSPAAPGASDLLSVSFLDSVWICVAEALPTVPTSPPATPTTTFVPSPATTPIGTSLLKVVPPEIGQGQTTTVEIAGQGAASAVAFADNVRYPLVANAGEFWGVIAAAGDAAVGVHGITVQLLDGNGNVMSELATQITVDDMGYPVENIDLPPAVNESLDPALIQQENDARAATFSQFTAQKLWLGQFIWPVEPVVVTSPYGIRRSYNGGPVSSFHGGIDLAADEGAPVAAANSGRVAWVGTGPDYGNTVLIDHGDGVFSGYSHLSAIAVQAGQMVNQGDLVGNVGSTGMATGSHLHWEIDVRGVPVDPTPWTLQSMGP